MKTNAKSFVVKENKGFRLKVESWECINPKDLITINFIQETLNGDGEVDLSSTYNYNLTKDEINTLVNGLNSL